MSIQLRHGGAVVLGSGAAIRPKAGRRHAIRRPAQGGEKTHAEHLCLTNVDYCLFMAFSSPEILTPQLAASIEYALEKRKALGLREFMGLLTK